MIANFGFLKGILPYGSCRLFVALFIAGGLLATSIQAQPSTPPLDERKAGAYDNGKMWTFEYPPIEYISEQYDFEPDQAWFEKARLGALRIPGCSASFVSPFGLVMTNHHCARTAITAVTREGEHLTDEGFYAASLQEERSIPNYYADQLVAITDVTDEVYAASDSAQTNAERTQFRQEAIEKIQARLAEDAGGDDEGIVVQVISLYHGGRYSAYTFRRYADVRLVLAPELQIGYYGGDSDNFTYPRYNLDMTYYRVYDDDGNPLQPDHFFPWSNQGTQEGDVVFVIGNPGSTYRLETVAQLEFRRDVQERVTLDFVKTRAAALQSYYDDEPTTPDAAIARDRIFALSNAEKLYNGRLTALNDEIVMSRRADTEQQLQAKLDAEGALKEVYGSLIVEISEIQRQKRALAAEYGAFFALTSSIYSSAVMRRALLARTNLEVLENRAINTENEEIPQPINQILTVPEQSQALAERLLAARLQDFVTYLGEDNDATQRILQGRTPIEAARAIYEASSLRDSSSTALAIAKQSLSKDDAALLMVEAFFERYQDYQSSFSGLMNQQSELASALGRARFEAYGIQIPPDATFSLRIADGVVKGYEYNGTWAPSHTTFYGMYDRNSAFHEADEAWILPERWQSPPASFDYATPLNFVSTVDIIGGNSGSPVLNKDLEVVGLVFDGNIESLSGSYLYLPHKARAVSVDVRGMLEAIDEIYGADRLVIELMKGDLVTSEADADALP